MHTLAAIYVINKHVFLYTVDKASRNYRNANINKIFINNKQK